MSDNVERTLGELSGKLDMVLASQERIEQAAIARDAEVEKRVRSLEDHRSYLYGAWVTTTGLFSAITAYLKFGGPST